MKAVEKKIAILAPLRSIEQLAREIVERQELNIDVEYVNENNFEEVTRKKIAEGKEIIISRGGIANRIREVSGLSVVDIEISGYDIVRILSKYVHVNKRLAFVERPEIIRNAKKVADSLDLDSKLYTVNRISEFESRFEQAMNDGIRIIVSGSWAVQYDDRYKFFEEKGIVYDVLESGEASIEEAIEKAIELYKMTVDERRKKEEFLAVINSIDEGVISLNTDMDVKTVNPAALDILGMNEENIIGKKIFEFNAGNVVKALESGINKIGKVGSIEGKEIVFNSMPILIDQENQGFVVSFQEVRKLQEIEHKVRMKLSEKGLVAKMSFKDIIGESDGIRRAINLSRNYSRVDSTILITGESGSGKEVFAQSIHNSSRRKTKPFVAVNCAALAPSLLESELFGYVEGAFTGARKKGKTGLFELAHTGTLFLDEIGEMDSVLQTRLLRAIQEKEIMKIGDDRIIPVDVRIIAATNKDLLDEVDRGEFREDLYYRLNVLRVKIPPLRERKKDIVVLAENYSDYLCGKYGFKRLVIDDEVADMFEEYRWPGNIRELQNIIERMVVFNQDNDMNDLDMKTLIIQSFEGRGRQRQEEIEIDMSRSLEDIEKQIIQRVLKEEKFNKTRTAERLGINRTTINRKLDT
ncbi:Transcriptional regulator containing PAS, AAA-type ATPase, and DNA-binding Fis domains [Dethiosulfatibacter aminovorans DSM 17477]|uniref:Transcriptional regulator containing PAS, AAA-type ATPase, and DNA-binding Fis domains n=1 Tax=Dethiosulfatibacter aminovorans DSM 17477 TaxID=1121476 RepID=A0A1M6AVZ5_9FIRM|nr:sigma 54-interacting transcriptional regulator [Dethiosulfatibacter aminovorans]SHI40610.1 Transcriptional regulator containing PAS, AAA-type ATPase, and DNA-binding Fis domains [Dethiosulfatibacter aminovorans DSM 17477]